MDAPWILPAALIQYPIVGFLLLLILWKLRPWAFDFRIREKLFAWCLYIPYLLSSLLLLTVTVNATIPTFTKQHSSVAILVFFGFVLLVVPAFAYHALLYSDPRSQAAKKSHKIHWFLNLVDSMLLSLFAMPITIPFLIRNTWLEIRPEDPLWQSTAVLMIIVALSIYRMANLPQRMNQTKVWWLILIEWTLLAMAYVPLLRA